MLSLDGRPRSIPYRDGADLMVGWTSSGDLVFRIGRQDARIVEVVCDFGPIAGVRILAMATDAQGCWSLRLPAGTACLRYRFRLDGELIRDPDAPTSSHRHTWRDLPQAA